MFTRNKGRAGYELSVADGLLVALGSAYIYLLAYFYEVGYCTHFGIPENFISPNIATMLMAAAGVLTLAIGSLQFFGLALPFFRAARSQSEGLRPYRFFFAFNGVMVVLGIILWATYGVSWIGAMWFLVAMLLMNFIFFGIDLVFNRDKKSLREKFEAMGPMESDPFDVIEAIERLVGRKVLFVGFLLVAILFVSYLAGNGEAAKKKEFLVFKNQDPYILLRTYGDILIAAPVDLDNHQVQRDLLIIKMSPSDRLEFLSKSIGPLKLAPRDH